MRELDQCKEEMYDALGEQKKMRRLEKEWREHMFDLGFRVLP